ncbi:sigma-70 family RNA polymerase sigma factor [Bacillus smithii]|uniref:sigma-70 family RNA polymerase sigma factor n=1 Tax=Bacillus smithii TaxID=1479 RepID=UPI0030C9652D
MKNGPVYSNISIINQAFRNLGSPLHRDLIIDFVRTHWGNGRGLPIEEAKELVKLPLEVQFYYEKTDEDDHFSRKEIHCEKLNHLYHNMKLNPYPQLYSRKTINVTMNEIYLDPRFDTIASDDGTIYLVLSEWNLLNDLIFRYMLKNNIDKISISEVYRNVLSKYSIDDPNAYFFPKIDPRFYVDRKQTVSLVEREYTESLVPIQVTDYIKEKVAIHMPTIQKFVMNKKEAVKIRHIIQHIFHLQPHHPLFSSYFKAIKKIVPLFNHLFLIDEDSLLYSKVGEYPEIQQRQYLYGHTDVTSISRKINEQTGYHPDIDLQYSEKEEIKHITTLTGSRQKLSYTLRYYDRIQETLAAHYFIDWIENGYLKVNFLFEKQTIPLVIYYDEKQNILYGEQLSNLMIDYDLEPGQKLEFFLENNKLYMKLGVFDEKAHSEQMKYEDIAKLSQMKQFGTKSLMQHLAELLMLHPSGLHIREIVRDIQEETSYAESSIRNTLSSYPFFETIEGKVGYWKFNPRQWKKKYMELPKEEKTKHDSRQEHLPSLHQLFKSRALMSNKTKRRLTNQQYRLLPKETFLSLAWEYYSFTIYQYAKNFSCETVPLEDLYQEAYFALNKAYNKYNPDLGGSFYHYFRRHLSSHLRRYKLDHITLIRIPIHRFEQLIMEDQLLEQQLIANEQTTIDVLDSDYILYKTNYISFEELYSQYDEDADDEMRARLYCFFNNPFYEDISLRRKVYIDYSRIEEPEQCHWLQDNNHYEKKVENHLIAKDALRYLKNNVKNDRDYEVILHRYGFSTGEEMTLQEIGELYGVTRERIRQIENIALKKLKKFPSSKRANP